MKNKANFLINNFSTSYSLNYDDVTSLINEIDTREYGKTRNYLAGAVSRLSPFITHGVISTHQVAQQLLSREAYGRSVDEAYRRIEPYLFQLAWRDYFHRLWEFHQEKIFSNLNHEQKKVLSNKIPLAVLNAETGINVLDQQLQQLYQTGYIHNHARMWIAAFVCNVTGTDWRTAATWFHYHLIDGDLASNSLSWQWVAGTLNKHKKHYIANQENINKYALSKQSGTALDYSYDELNSLIPLEIDLKTQTDYSLRDDWQREAKILIPEFSASMTINELRSQRKAPIYLRNIYQLDQAWQAEKGQHILLIEPKLINKHPLSPQRWHFIEHWASKIPTLKIVIASFSDFQQAIVANPGVEQVIFKQHSFSTHWQGQSEKSVWLFDELEGEYASFFKFWNKAKKQIKHKGINSIFDLSNNSSN